MVSETAIATSRALVGVLMPVCKQYTDCKLTSQLRNESVGYYTGGGRGLMCNVWC